MKVRFAVGPPPGAVSGPELSDFALALEAHGFDGIWLSDLPVGGALDPLLALPLLAARTAKLRLGANVVPFGRSPYVLARTLAQLDQVTGGRLLLSFVTGLGQPGERAALQIGGANRGAMLEDVLELVRAFWSSDRGDGADPAGLPAAALTAAHPVQDPLEVWLGGRGPQALARVGRIADGWLGALLTADEARGARERIQTSAADAGRQIDPEHFGLSIGYARTAPDPLTLRNLAARRRDVDPNALLPVGKDGLRGYLTALIAAGLSKFVLRPAEPQDSPEAEISWLAEAILDLQS